MSDTKKEWKPGCWLCGRDGHFKLNCPRYDPNFAANKKKQRETNTFEAKKDGVKQKKKDKNKKDGNESNESFVVETEEVGLTIDEANTSLANDWDNWVLDTSSSSHMCSNLDSFTNYQKLIVARIVKFGGKQTCQGVGIGEVVVPCVVNGKTKRVKLKQVLHLPGLRRNLISVSKATDNGIVGKIQADEIRLSSMRPTNISRSQCKQVVFR